MRQVLSVAVNNQPDALLRLAGLLYRRGYTVERLSLTPSQECHLRITAVISIDRPETAGIEHQVRKFLDVISLDICPA